MYFLSNKYIQINNNTKNKIKVRIRIAPLVLGLEPARFLHFEINSLLLESLFKLESTLFSLENRG